jgi:predicted TIM-barrel fold metal-dependent hydrolase
MDDVVSQMKGSKPFRIDTHYHIFPPKFMANQAKRNPKAYDPRQVVPATIDLKDWTPGFAVEELDRGGIAVGIAQMIAAPGIWFGDVAAARDLAREWNEYAAQMGRDFPGRFGTLAVLPLPDVDSALREIEYALDTLHADGVQIMSHYDGRYPADPRFVAAHAQGLEKAEPSVSKRTAIERDNALPLFPRFAKAIV